MAAENMYNSAHKTSSDSYREGWDRIRGDLKNKSIKIKKTQDKCCVDGCKKSAKYKFVVEGKLILACLDHAFIYEAEDPLTGERYLSALGRLDKENKNG